MLAKSSQYKYTFTVFTPTYNRAHTLHRVFESLKAQTYKDFEWSIVDDGSTDNTSQLVAEWQTQVDFPIWYIYQENQGKNSAFNRGIEAANGELFLNLDSDDACIPEALDRFKYYWDLIPENEKPRFSAVTSLCSYENGEIVGKRFPSDITDSEYLEMRYRFKVTGEKWGFQRTDVLKEIKFVNDTNDNFVPEGVLWAAIAKKYKTRYVNESLRIYYDGADQITKTGNPAKHAKGHAFWHQTILNQEIDYFRYAPLKFFISSVHHSRFSLHSGVFPSDQVKSLTTPTGKFLWLISFPISYTVYLFDKLKTR